MADLEIGIVARDETAQGLRQASARLSKFGDEGRESVEEIGKGSEQSSQRISGLGVASGAALAGIAAGAAAAGVAIVASALSSSRELRNLSQTARLNVEDLQAMGAVAKATGGNVEDIADASRELQLRLSEATALGTGPAVDALNLLGLSIADIQGLNSEESFALIRDRLSEIEDPARRAFLAEELLGGSTERLTGFLETNSEAFREQIQAVRDSGRVISEDAVEANAAAADAVDGLTASLGALTSELVAELAPAITATTGVLGGLLEIVRENNAETNEFKVAVEELGGAGTVTGGIMFDLTGAVADLGEEVGRSSRLKLSTNNRSFERVEPGNDRGWCCCCDCGSGSVGSCHPVAHEPQFCGRAKP